MGRKAWPGSLHGAALLPARRSRRARVRRARAHCMPAPPQSPPPPLSRPQADGSVVVPEVLRPFMMGIDVIRPKKKVQAGEA